MGAVVVNEADERFPVGPRGERGAQGNQGNRGERGQLSRLQGRAVVVLFALAFLSSASGWFWQAHQADAATAAQHQEQAAQQRQGQLLEQKLCTSLGRLAALKPPPGNPASNPSRAFDDEQHAVLAQLGPDVGCRGAR
jgi:hypothetical protein